MVELLVILLSLLLQPQPHHLDEHLGGLLQGRGAQFQAAADCYDIPVDLLAAIAIHETGGGTSAVLQDACNIAGVNWTPTMYVEVNGDLQIVPTTFQRHGWYVKYDSIEQSIHDTARRLRWFYYDEGRTTVQSIGAKWAPTSDDRGDNSTWVSDVTTVRRSLQ